MTARTLIRLGLGAAVAAALAVVALQWRKQVAVRAALPPAPDLSARPAALEDELAAALRRARSFWHGADGLARVSRLYHANGFHLEAMQGYRALAALEPRRPIWPHFLAVLQSTYGQLDDALPWARRTLELAPGYAPAHLRMADILFKSNQVADAEKAYGALLKLEPGNPYALLGQSRCREKVGDLSGAKRLLQEAIAAEPKFAAAWSLLATMAEKEGRPEEAKAARKRGEVRFREMTDPWIDGLLEECFDAYQLSVAADVGGDRHRAIELLERAIALSPNVSTYHRQVAKHLMALKEHPRARTHLERAVALSPTDSESWSTLITLLMETKDQRAAMSALTTALSQCPESGYLHYLNGNRLMATGRLAEAEQALKRSKLLQPAEVRAYIQLSVLYVEQQRFDEAMAEVLGANAADPGNLMVMVLAARLAVTSRNEADAQAWIHKLRTAPAVPPEDLADVTTLFREQFGHAPQ